MAYLGNTPASRFTSMDKQTITGNGGTSYALDHAVGSEQEIEVFVNNVRQEPSVAYTVAGTALTMTGNVASTDNFYVVYQGKAQQGVTHPSNSALVATTGTFSSNVDVGGSLLVDTIKDGANTNTAMAIDSSGRVTTPSVPAWRVSPSGGLSVSSAGWTVVQLDTSDTENRFLNGGVTLNSYKVVVPVTGIYAVHSFVRIDDLGTGYVQISIMVNDVNTGVSDSYSIDGSPPSDYVTLNASDVFSINADDTFTLSVYASTDASWTINANTMFSGHLVG